MTLSVLVLLVLSLATLSQSASLNQRLSGELSTMSVSESIEQANENIEDGDFQHGDIAASTNTNDDCSIKGCLWPKPGRYVYVPYTLSPDFSDQQRASIFRVFISFRRLTCVRFIPQRTQSDYIHFFSGNGCWSVVGHQGGQQKISLADGCFLKGSIQHEVLHALGFNHEHVRTDRDEYVEILTENIQQGREHNFYKEPTNNMVTPYDFFSVMHYNNFDFSRNGLPTIVARDDPTLQLGNFNEMTQKDADRVNKLYGC